VAPWAQYRVLTAALVLACSLSTACLAGCAPPDSAKAITVSWTLDPSPPIVGEPIAARLTLRDRNQQPVTGAQLRLEGLMSHPGMKPVLAAVVERGDGTYEAALRFTMAGDWILLVTGELPGGGRLEKRIEIAGVRPAS
jgi:hypothetical protein